MGLNIREIVPRRQITFEELNGKIIAVDAFNAIYQFLSSIRQYDGTPLTDKQGRITSHLSGLFNRNINLLSEGMKLIYVFDGKPPELKKKTRESRQDVKDIAKEKLAVRMAQIFKLFLKLSALNYFLINLHIIMSGRKCMLCAFSNFIAASIHDNYLYSQVFHILWA